MIEKPKRSAAKRKRDAIKESGIITYLLTIGVIILTVMAIVCLLTPTMGNIVSGPLGGLQR
jgi:hypothetical protein